jgi:hypothetical protein
MKCQRATHKKKQDTKFHNRIDGYSDSNITLTHTTNNTPTRVTGRDIKHYIRDKTHLQFLKWNHIKDAYVTLTFTYSYIQATSFSRPNVKRGYDFRLLWQPSSQVRTLLDMFTVLFVFSPAGRLPARRAILPSFSTHTKTHTHTHIYPPFSNGDPKSYSHLLCRTDRRPIYLPF